MLARSAATSRTRPAAGVVRISACCAALALITGLVGCPRPAPPQDILTVAAGDDQTLPVGAVGTATATAAGATGAATFAWTITSPGEIVDGGTSETVNFTANSPGTATLTVTATDDSGATATDEVQVTFEAAPLSVNAGNDRTLVVGESVQLGATAVGGAPPYTFQWQQQAGPAQPISPDDGAAAEITVAASTPGAATFQVTVTDSADSTATDSAVVTIDASPVTLTFTLGPDDLTGTDTADAFRAPSIDVQSNGIFLPTFQTGDRADGLGGSDTLSATLAGPAGPAIVPAAVTSIEAFSLTNITTGGSAQSIDMTNVTGVTTLNSVNSTSALTLVDVRSLADLGLTNASAGMEVQFTPGATSGATDEISLTLANVTAGTVQFNGVETLNIASIDAPNVLDAILSNNELQAVNLTGDQPLVLGRIPSDNLATFDASTHTAGLSVRLGPGFPSPFSFTGTSGDDSVLFPAFPPNSSMDGGPGRDVLQMTAEEAAAFASPPSSVTGFEELAVTTPVVGDINATLFGGVAVLRLLSGMNADPPRTLTVPADGQVIIQGQVGGSTRRLTVAGSGGLTFTVDASARTPGIQLLQPEHAQLRAGRFLTPPLFESLTFSNVATVQMEMAAVSESAPGRRIPTIALPDTPADEVLAVSGSAGLDADLIFADTIDARNLAGGLFLGGASALTIFGTPADDEITASGTINAGAGNDLLSIGGLGIQTVTLGPGADKVFISFADGPNRKIVSDFDDTPGTGDVLSFLAPTFAPSGTDNFASAASIRDHTSGTVILGPQTELLRITGASLSGLTGANSLNGTNLLAALRGGIVVNAVGNANFVAIRSEEVPVIGTFARTLDPAAQIGGIEKIEVGIYYGVDADENAQLTAAELTLVAVLQGPNVSITGLTFQNFSTEPPPQ